MKPAAEEIHLLCNRLWHRCLEQTVCQLAQQSSVDGLFKKTILLDKIVINEFKIMYFVLLC
jgi:hypothetical protein